MLSATEERRPPRNRLLANHLDEDEQAAELGVTTRTLRSWRQRGYGPPFIKVGRAVFYEVSASIAWLKQLQAGSVSRRSA